jgi:anhydro-N-acetylmuramic acid kinase
MLAKNAGKQFDDGGHIAEKGKVLTGLLSILNDLEYYRMPYPKSLSNDFGTGVVYSLIQDAHGTDQDDLRTYVEHVSFQITKAVEALQKDFSINTAQTKMLVTGGGARNSFLVSRLGEMLVEKGVTIEVPRADLADFKEAIIMGLIGVLRWREENNTLASVTGASRDSIGGAVWIGQEA